MLAVQTGAVNVLASYAASYYAGNPAVTLFRNGKGRVIHFGSFFTRQNVSALLDALQIQDPIQEWAEVPGTVEAIARSNGTQQYCFLLNFSNEPQRLNFKRPAFELVGDRNLQGPEMIPGHGVFLVRLGSEGK